MDVVLIFIHDLKLRTQIFRRLSKHLSKVLRCNLNILLLAFEDGPDHLALDVGEHLEKVFEFLLRDLLLRLLHVLQAVFHYL